MPGLRLNRAARWLLLAAAGVAGAAALFAATRAPVEGPPQAALGDPARCTAYSGLPPGWGATPQAGMAHLPGGAFTLGSRNGYPEEQPAADGGRTRVAGFWIDRTEVTTAQFAAFVAATRYVTDAEKQGGAALFQVPSVAELQQRPNAWWRFVKGADWRHPEGPSSNTEGRANRPVTLVTQADALAYARWLGRDLPTETEWEYAGKAGRDGMEIDSAPRDGAGKPAANYWQGNFPLLDTHEDGYAGLAPAGCYAPNAFGLYDMVGNAWEWTRDAFEGQHQPHGNGDAASVLPGRTAQAASPNAAQTVAAREAVIKGGSFLCSRDFCVRYRASAREAQEADLPAAHVGFRTVLRDRG